MVLKFRVEGKPFGKQRPRVARIGNITRAYTPKETVHYEEYIKLCFLAAPESTCFRENFYSSPLKLTVKAFYAIPKGISLKARKALITANAGVKMRPAKRPDIDNLCKVVLDALNTIAFKDDNQIVELIAEKWYAEIPCIEISLENLD